MLDRGIEFVDALLREQDAFAPAIRLRGRPGQRIDVVAGWTRDEVVRADLIGWG